jgi:hypothetical protein
MPNFVSRNAFLAVGILSGLGLMAADVIHAGTRRPGARSFIKRTLRGFLPASTTSPSRAAPARPESIPVIST